MNVSEVELGEFRKRLPVDALGHERRWTHIEPRAADGTDDGFTFEGYASVFDQRIRIGGGYEEIAPSAYNNTLQRSDIFLLWNHDNSMPLARNGTGDLELAVDDYGLKVRARFVDTQYARDAAELIRSGTSTKMSIGFSVAPGGDTYTRTDDGALLRRINDLRLWEASVVGTHAAYDGTSAAVRSDAFGLLCRSLGWDEVDVLARCQTGDMIDLSAASLRAEPGAVTTSEDASQAATTVTAGDPTHRLLLMRLRERARGTELPKVSNGTPSGTGPGR
jgi:uncharacterized protein